MTVQSPPPPPPSYGAPVTPGAPKKKGLSPLAWVGIGCGAILLIGAIIAGSLFAWGVYKAKQYVDNPDKAKMAAVEFMIRANPDVELVSKDEEAQTFTIRNKKDGETVTVNLADIEDGNISFETSEGEGSVSMGEEGMTVKDGEGNTTFQAGGGTTAPKDLPDWVPVYPGGQIQGNMTSDTPEQKVSSFSLTTQDSVDDLVKFYEEQLKAKGLEIEQNAMGSDANSSGGMLSAKSSDDARNVIIMVSSNPEGGASAQVTYTEKK